MRREHFDQLIVGAGPGGLQLGYFFARHRRDYAILEAADVAGSFFRTFPRHRRLISINKVHTGRKDPAVQFRWDWNSLLSDDRFLFKGWSEEYFPSADAMVDYLGAFAEHHGLAVRYGQRVERISRHGDGFAVETGDGAYTARRVIVATGVCEPYVPPIPGIELAASYTDFDADPRHYTDRSVLVIGKGNSGFETAASLIPYAAQIHLVSPHDVRHAWHSHYVGDLRAVNNNLIDTDQLKAQNATIWGEVVSIERYRDQIRVRISHIDSDRAVFTHYYDDVICCAGFRMSLEPFDRDCRPATVLDGRFPKLTPEWESADIGGLFFCGTLMQSRDYKRSSSAFVHGFRYNARALFHVLSLIDGGDWPSELVPLDPEALTNRLMERVNTATSLFHQFDVLADVVDLDGPCATYYPDVPVDLALTSPRFAFVCRLHLTFTHDKPDDAERGRLFSPVPALHPRLRWYQQGELVAEYHVFEDLEAEWFEEKLYIAPVERFLAERTLAPTRNAR
jgi:thioredoxin reductase